MTPSRVLVSLLAAAGLLAAASPASAQIVSPSKKGARATDIELPLLIGAGFEFQSDSEAKEYAFPVTVEYSFTEEFKLVVEWDYVEIRSKVSTIRSASGMGDLETFVEWEFLPERRYRPALTFEGGIKWPTAKSPDIGSGEADYALGLIASKEFVGGWTVDLGLVYTLVGSPKGVNVRDIFEVSLAAEWEFSHVIDFEAELLYSRGGEVRGAVPGQFAGAGTLFGGGSSEFELSIGMAEHVSKYMKFEEGAVVQPDGSWQIVFFWELDLSGGK